MRLDETLHHPYTKSMVLTFNALNDSHVPNHEDKSCQGIVNKHLWTTRLTAQLTGYGGHNTSSIQSPPDHDEG
jgi:hypothetical protein